MSIVLDKAIVSNPTTKRSFTTHLSYDKLRNKLIYPSGKCVIIRSLGDDNNNWIFNGHKFPVTVAKISPSGYYIASGDEMGNVIIWDCSNDEMRIKNEFKILSNRINDLSWDSDSKRIIAVGNGSETFGHCFTMDTGNSVGEIIGHSNQINSVDIRQKRPYSAITVGDDLNVVLFKGPPFKFISTCTKVHSNFIKMVRYSPNGELFITVGVDRIISIFNGNNGELLKSLSNLTNGGIYSIDWINNENFIISSADCSLRLININDGNVIKTWSLDNKIENQLLGCCVIDENKFITISLNGTLYIFNNDNENPVQIIDAHQVSITSLNYSNGLLYTGSYDGKIIKHNDTSSTLIKGHDQHKGLIVSIEGLPNSQNLLSTSWDDKLNLINEDSTTKTLLKLSKQPIDLKINSTNVVVLFEDEINFYDLNGEFIKSFPLDYESSSLDISDNFIIITDSKKYTINIYDLKMNLINNSNKLYNKPTSTSISHNNQYFACGDVQGKILLFSLNKDENFKLITSRWAFNSSKINSIKWSPNNQFIVSASLDTNIIIYSVEKPSRTIKFLNSHKEGVNAIDWLNDNKIVSAGTDGCIKYWDIKYPA